MAKTFKQIQAEVAEKDQRAQDFVDMAKGNTEFARYEENRKQDKQIRKEMLLMYRSYAEEDPKYKPIFEKLQKLADYDVSAGSDYEKESDLYKELCEEMEKYDDFLNQREEALHQEAIKRLKIEKNGEMVWASEEEKLANPAMLQADIKISEEENRIDNMRRLNADIWHYFELQRDGHLQVPSGARVIDSVGKTFGMADYDYNAPVRTAMEMGFQRNNKERPLFPHEPNQNDVRQGLVGDCFYLATIANIARLNPDYIKQAMRDNQDGTVTVRLFSKNKKGEYNPVFVRVSKEIDSYGGLFTGGGENCVWLNCFERALAASGLYSMAKQGRDEWEPVPENIEEIYKDLKAKEGRGELTGDALDQAQADYPWLFKNTKENGKELLPWPNFNSISGGKTGTAGEILLGPGYKKTVVKMPPKDEGGYIRNVPQNALQLLIIGNIHAAKDLSVDSFDSPEKPLNFGSTPDEALENMWAVLQEDPDKNKWIKVTKDQFKDLMTRVAAGLETYARDHFGDASPENLVEAAKKYKYEEEGMLIDMKRTCSILTSNMFRAAVNIRISRYSEAEEKMYAAIRECEMRRIPMGCASPSEGPVAGNHAYSMLGAYEGSDGRKYVRVRNPWGASWMDNGLETIFDAQGKATHNWKKVEEGVFDVELSEWSTIFDSADFNGYERDDVKIPGISGKNWGWSGDEASLKTKEFMFHEIMKRIAIANGVDKESYKTFNFEMKGISKLNFGTMIENALIKALERQKMLPENFSEQRALKADIRNTAGSVYDEISGILEQYYQNPSTAGKGIGEIVSDIKGLFDQKFGEMQAEYMRNPPANAASRIRLECFMHTLDCLSAKDMSIKSGTFAKDCAMVTGAFNKIQDILQRIDPNNPAQRVYIGDINGTFDPTKDRPYLKTVFKDERNIMMATMVNEYNEELTVPFNELFIQNREFSFRDVRPEVLQGLIKPGDPITQEVQANVQQQGLQEPLPPMERKPKAGTFRDYLKVIDDVDKVLAGSKSMLDGSSNEFNNLRKKLKDVKKEIVEANGKNFGKLAETLGKLEPELAAYDQRCQSTPKNNWRRQMRTQACDMLKDLISSAREAETQPLKTVEKEYTKKMISQIYRSKAKEISAERLDELAGHMLEDQHFKGFVKNQSAYTLKFATDKDISKGVEKLNKAEEKNIQKNEVNFETRAMSM